MNNTSTDKKMFRFFAPISIIHHSPPTIVRSPNWSCKANADTVFLLCIKLTDMETEHNNQEQDLRIEWERTQRRGRIMGGLLVMTAGFLFLGKVLGATIPTWVFTWKMLLIAIALQLAVKHAFRRFFWIPLMLVGLSFLIVQDLAPTLEASKFIWPVAIILLGLMVMLKPRKKCEPHYKHWKRYNNYKAQHCNADSEVSSEDALRTDIIFSGVKKNIISKDFKGGQIRIIFGGAEINLSQSDIIGSAEIDITQVFGGLKLVVPAHWKVKSEIVTVMAGIEDKRNIQKDFTTDRDKVLVLKGNIVFGGIEIKSY